MDPATSRRMTRPPVIPREVAESTSADSALRERGSCDFAQDDDRERAPYASSHRNTNEARAREASIKRAFGSSVPATHAAASSALRPNCSWR